MKTQIFWDNLPAENDFERSGSTMYRKGDFIIFEHIDFDGEDQRTYEYAGKFPVEGYKKAFEELQKNGKAELIGPDSTLIMSLKDGIVHLSFRSSPSPSSTPGGATISGTIQCSCKIEKMLLEK